MKSCLETEQLIQIPFSICYFFSKSVLTGKQKPLYVYNVDDCEYPFNNQAYKDYIYKPSKTVMCWANLNYKRYWESVYNCWAQNRSNVQASDKKQCFVNEFIEFIGKLIAQVSSINTTRAFKKDFSPKRLNLLKDLSSYLQEVNSISGETCYAEILTLCKTNKSLEQIKRNFNSDSLIATNKSKAVIEKLHSKTYTETPYDIELICKNQSFKSISEILGQKRPFRALITGTPKSGKTRMIDSFTKENDQYTFYYVDVESDLEREESIAHYICRTYFNKENCENLPDCFNSVNAVLIVNKIADCRHCREIETKFFSMHLLNIIVCSYAQSLPIPQCIRGNVQGIPQEKVISILKEKGDFNANKNLINILRSPLYMNMFLNSSGEENEIKTIYELISRFLRFQIN